jgi:hypothetical protein
MASLDVFNSDAFSLSELTAAIQALPYQPGRIGAAGIFSERAMNTLDAYIEVHNGVLSLVPVSQRGGAATPAAKGSRLAKSFRVAHLQQDDLISADEITGVRAFGSESDVETMVRVVADRLAPMRKSIEYTLEAHRLAAVMGSYYDAAGNSVSLFTEFGVSQQSVNFVLGTATTKIRQKCLEVQEKVEDAIGGLSFSGIRVFCGKTFWSEIIEHPLVRDSYLNTAMAGELRGDPRMEFEFGGMVFERYRGTSAVKIGDNHAYAVPEGVSDLFITRFGPGDFVEAAGTLGQRLYARQWETSNGKGIYLEAQSNPLNICTRPASVVQLTVAGS